MADEKDANPEQDQHLIDGHSVVIHQNIIYVDGVQATLGRTDLDVLAVLGQFFDHLRAESRSGEKVAPVTRRERRELAQPAEVELLEVSPGTTIVINVAR